MLLLAVFALSACGEKKSTKSSEPKEKISAPVDDNTAAERVQCPVCGLSFPKNKKAKSFKYKNKEYYFYIEDHYKEFAQNPEKYIGK